MHGILITHQGPIANKSCKSCKSSLSYIVFYLLLTLALGVFINPIETYTPRDKTEK